MLKEGSLLGDELNEGSEDGVLLVVGPSKTNTVGSLLTLGSLLGARLTLGALLGDVGCSLILGVWLGSNNGFVIRNGAKFPRRNGLGALLTLGS